MANKMSRLTRFFIIGVFLLALIARIIPGPRTIDDSYITFRYSRNILAGNGFVFNRGERVLGTTTPLYTILLSSIALFTGKTNAPFPWIALIINALADAVTCVLLFQICKKSGFTIAGISLALVWAIAPYSVTFAIGGLETSLYILLLVSAFYFYLHNHYQICALFLGFSFLTRPDALIFIGLYLVSRLCVACKTRSYSISTWSKEIAAFLLPVLPWMIFASIYFGNPIPHSLLAKSVTYSLPSNAALERLIQHYATPFLEHLTFGVPSIAVGLVLYPFLSLVALYHFWKNDQQMSIVLLYPFLYFGVFAIANPLIFRWYLSPPLPFYFMLILIGAEKMLKSLLTVRGIDRFQKRTPTLFNYGIIPVIIILPPLLFSAKGWTMSPDHGNKSPAPEMAYIQLELLYKNALDKLLCKVNVDTNATLAAGDVGVLGYYSGLRILDTVGLNSTEALDYYPLDKKYYAINYAIPPDLIMDYKPEYIIILEVYGRLGLLKDNRFNDTYTLIEKIPTDMYGSDGMLIFSKK